jgi:predicted AAA+ superfamily ATPase
MSSLPNPYRAAGTFAGPSYTERKADKDLIRAIQQNQRFPYVLAPRQSGKSSLITHARGKLSPPEYRTAFIDFLSLILSIPQILGSSN